jgi:hypothetical protein
MTLGSERHSMLVSGDSLVNVNWLSDISEIVSEGGVKNTVFTGF